MVQGDSNLVFISGHSIDFQAGDVGFVPKNLPHYIDNTGKGILRVAETSDSQQFMSVPLAQRLKYTPHTLVTATIGIGEDILAAIQKDKTPIVGRKKLAFGDIGLAGMPTNYYCSRKDASKVMACAVTFDEMKRYFLKNINTIS